MGQKRTYKQYSKEYKEEAVALVREQGYSVPDAAKSLGIAREIYKTYMDMNLQLNDNFILCILYKKDFLYVCDE